MQGAPDPAALADKWAIQEQIYNYCRSVDRLDVPLGHAVFHEGSYADFPTFKGTGQGWIDDVCKAHLDFLHHSHQVTNVIIHVDGDTAGSEAYVIANLRQQHHIVHSGRRAVGSGWLPVEIQRVPLEAKPIKNGTTTGSWTAPKWEIARPEGNDHMKFGSLRGDTVVPHAPPISMCVGKGVERFMPDRLQR